MGHPSKVAATLHAKKALAGMPPGWKIRVWENLGWNFSLENHPASIHESYPDGYYCLIAGDKYQGSGRGCWTTRRESAKTPIGALRLAIMDFDDYMEREMALLVDTKAKLDVMGGGK